MIATPPLIPRSNWNALSLAIARRDIRHVRDLVEEHSLDVNAFLDSTSWMPLLMDALLSGSYEREEDRLPLLRYLLDKGANPSVCCARGYNCLHIAVQQDKYVKALDLFLDYKADVNVVDGDGANVIYWAIQRWLLRNGETDRAEHLRVFDKILRLGADLDQVTRYGMTARQWLSVAPPDVQQLVTSWEAGRPRVNPAHTEQPVLAMRLKYPEIALRIWNEMVPPSGPAPTVQGELLRSVESMRDHAGDHTPDARKNNRRLAAFVRDTLIRSGIYNETEKKTIRAATAKLRSSSRPNPQDAIYDHLIDQVCVFYTRHEEPIPYKPKP
ncbi:MAG TPA: ankyrin repeat domain-containing protein [Puia sp.]|nr:ankyrin repeat domain-containing protein [Puia sp.]